MSRLFDSFFKTGSNFVPRRIGSNTIDNEDEEEIRIPFKIQIPLPVEESDKENGDSDGNQMPSRNAKKTQTTKKKKTKKNNHIQEDELEETPDPKITYEPAMLPAMEKEYAEWNEQRLLDEPMSNPDSDCKLCNLGDSNITKLSSESLREIFDIEKKMFRRIRDGDIWKLIVKKWENDIVIPNRKIGCIIQPLTILETARHFTDYHDSTNAQRIVWDDNQFVLASMERFRREGGVWNRCYKDGVQIPSLKFQRESYADYSRLSRDNARLLLVAQRLEMTRVNYELLQSPQMNSRRSGSGKGRHSSDNPPFSPY